MRFINCTLGKAKFNEQKSNNDQKSNIFAEFTGFQKCCYWIAVIFNRHSKPNSEIR